MNCAIQSLLMKIFYTFAFILLSFKSICQQTDTTANTLSSVEVKAYGQVRRFKDVPAAVAFINGKTFNRFGSASVVQAVNTVPGVRMEERSPGSYRFSIRGSSLRSPFGVRNVKVYYNDIPFTDPGGHTYLNGLGYYNFGSMEILKGPGSSLYGAGTGGVLLIDGLRTGEDANVLGEYTLGSFGLRNAFASATLGDANSKSQVGFQHQASDGYRYHSGLERKVLSWTGNYHFGEKQALKTTFLYSDLFYETPGALTKAEYDANPRGFRPAGGGFPSAEQAGASISQKTFLAGASFTHQFSSSITNQSTAYGMFTELRNPAIRNYGKALEPHVGGRTVFTYKKQWKNADLHVSFGGELQQGFATSTTLKNRGGQPDSLQTEDDIRIRQSFLFLQTGFSLKGWELIAGGSLNGSALRFQRTAPDPLPEQRRTLNNQFTPRLALERRFPGFTVYSSLSKGFSPPSSSELLPSGSAINLSLQAEEGANYDLGIRGTVAKELTFDVNAFFYRLENAIVQRRDAGGGDYFINAGETAQKGIETSLSYSFLKNSAFFRPANVWINHTYHHFRYRDFKQLAIDYSGKALPGTAPHTFSSGIEIMARNGLLGNMTFFYSGRTPLNDANTAYADKYFLLGAKFGFEKLFQNNVHIRLVAGADNLFDQRYSLGNDINGFGGRYYNAAAGRNFYVSLLLQLITNR